MNSFTKYILKNSSGIVGKLPALPLMHTTDAKNFRTIINTCRLNTEACKIFGDELLYFFYGRPAYKINPQTKPTSMLHAFPVCFILKPNSIKYARRVYPFDSGAFEQLVSNYTGKLELDNFLIDPSPTSAGKIPTPEMPACVVSTFFKNNCSYYWGIPKSIAELPPLEFEAHCYLDILSSKVESALDDRRGSIEVQLDRSIELSPDTIEAIVLPQSFMSDENVLETVVDKWKATPITYNTYHNSPSAFVAVVIQKVGDFLDSEGLL